MKIIVDLDGTICTEEKQFSRSLAKVNPGAKKALRLLKEKGFNLIIYSARTWAEYELTIDWLNKNDIPFDQLILGKPQGDYWIDDRAIKYKSWDSILKEIL